jgi:hypothetical protein
MWAAIPCPNPPMTQVPSSKLSLLIRQIYSPNSQLENPKPMNNSMEAVNLYYIKPLNFGILQSKLLFAQIDASAYLRILELCSRSWDLVQAGTDLVNNHISTRDRLPMPLSFSYLFSYLNVVGKPRITSSSLKCP